MIKPSKWTYTMIKFKITRFFKIHCMFVMEQCSILMIVKKAGKLKSTLKISFGGLLMKIVGKK